MPAIGQSVVRIDAREKVTGEALYASDISFPNQLYMKILFANRPHARIRSIKTNLAESIQGVVAIFTAKDVPVNEYGSATKDQPVLCGPGSSIPDADRVRFVGDQVALVVAETEEIASAACSKIEVDYEDLPVVTDVKVAMQPDAPLLHTRKGSNIISHKKIRFGDIDTAFAESDVIVEGEYHTPVQEHAFLETEAGVSYIDDEGRITVVFGGQWAYKDREEITHVLDLPEEKVRVIYPYVGGAFGGREDASVQIVLALAAYKLEQRGIKRPIKIVWTREESIRGHYKRHPVHIHARWGANKAGKILAAEVNLISDAGAYEYSSNAVISGVMKNVTGPYEIPNVKVDGYVVLTNTVPRGAFRGFGTPQGTFAAEGQIDKLASKLGLDPVEIRMRNLIQEGSLQPEGSPWPPGVSARQVVETCARAAGWTESQNGWNRPAGRVWSVEGKPHLVRAIGFGCAAKSTGFTNGFQDKSTIRLELHGEADIEQVLLITTSSEIGQGAHTVLAQMAAHALQVPLEKVKISMADTASAPDTGASCAQRMTFMAGNAIREASEKALKIWHDEERPVKVEHCYYAKPTTEVHPETGQGNTIFACSYIAGALEIELDIDTGVLRIIRVVNALDAGKAINPQMVTGQAEGGIVQGLGYTLTENMIERDGYVLTPDFTTYLIPTVLDVPEILETVLLENADPRGPWGARGIGEMQFLPIAPSISSALHAITGQWIGRFPYLPHQVLEALKLGENEKQANHSN